MQPAACFRVAGRSVVQLHVQLLTALLGTDAQIAAAEDSYPTKLQGSGEKHKVGQSSVWEPNMTVGKNDKTLG